MQKNVAHSAQIDKGGGKGPVRPDDAVESLHGGDAMGDSELVLPAHDDEKLPEEERRKP